MVYSSLWGRYHPSPKGDLQKCLGTFHYLPQWLEHFMGGTRDVRGFPQSSVGKESACNAGDLGLIAGLGKSPGEGYPLQYFGLENSMDCKVHGVTKSPTWLSDLRFHFHFSEMPDILQSPGEFPEANLPIQNISSLHWEALIELTS